MFCCRKVLMMWTTPPPTVNVWFLWGGDYKNRFYLSEKFPLQYHHIISVNAIKKKVCKDCRLLIRVRIIHYELLLSEYVFSFFALYFGFIAVLHEQSGGQSQSGNPLNVGSNGLSILTSG